MIKLILSFGTVLLFAAESMRQSSDGQVPDYTLEAHYQWASPKMTPDETLHPLWQSAQQRLQALNDQLPEIIQKVNAAGSFMYPSSWFSAPLSLLSIYTENSFWRRGASTLGGNEHQLVEKVFSMMRSIKEEVESLRLHADLRDQDKIGQDDPWLSRIEKCDLSLNRARTECAEINQSAFLCVLGKTQDKDLLHLCKAVVQRYIKEKKFLHGKECAKQTAGIQKEQKKLLKQWADCLKIEEVLSRESGVLELFGKGAANMLFLQEWHKYPDQNIELQTLIDNGLDKIEWIQCVEREFMKPQKYEKSLGAFLKEKKKMWGKEVLTFQEVFTTPQPEQIKIPVATALVLIDESLKALHPLFQSTFQKMFLANHFDLHFRTNKEQRPFFRGSTKDGGFVSLCYTGKTEEVYALVFEVMKALNNELSKDVHALTFKTPRIPRKSFGLLGEMMLLSTILKTNLLSSVQKTALYSAYMDRRMKQTYGELVFARFEKSVCKALSASAQNTPLTFALLNAHFQSACTHYFQGSVENTGAQSRACYTKTDCFIRMLGHFHVYPTAHLLAYKYIDCYAKSQKECCDNLAQFFSLGGDFMIENSGAGGLFNVKSMADSFKWAQPKFLAKQALVQLSLDVDLWSISLEVGRISQDKVS